VALRRGSWDTRVLGALLILRFFGLLLFLRPWITFAVENILLDRLQNPVTQTISEDVSVCNVLVHSAHQWFHDDALYKSTFYLLTYLLKASVAWHYYEQKYSKDALCDTRHTIRPLGFQLSKRRSMRIDTTMYHKYNQLFLYVFCLTFGWATIMAPAVTVANRCPINWHTTVSTLRVKTPSTRKWRSLTMLRAECQLGRVCEIRHVMSV